MMSDYMSPHFEQHENNHREQVTTNTWGHLFPQGKYYDGWVIIAKSIYGDEMHVIDELIDIEGSPWWHDTIYEFAERMSRYMSAGSVTKFMIAVNVRTYKNGSKRMFIKKLRQEQIHKGW